MSDYLRLVNHEPFDLLAFAERRHEERAVWLERRLVDRSRWKGSAGVHALKQMRPLEHDEQACKDRCDEKVRAAKAGSFLRDEIVDAFKGILRS